MLKTISTESLLLVTGGSKDSDDLDEKERMRDYERAHPFSAMWCQGDRRCLRDGGAK
jgi:hypothetical protein